MAQVEVDRARRESETSLTESPTKSDADASPEKQKKRYYKPTGRPRGRPRKDPSELARPRPGTRPRGRPKRSGIPRNTDLRPIAIKPSNESPVNNAAAGVEQSSEPMVPSPAPKLERELCVFPNSNNPSIIGEVVPVSSPIPNNAILAPRRKRGRPPTISSDSPPRVPVPVFANSLQEKISETELPVKRKVGRPRIHPRPPEGAPKRGRGRPKIHHHPEDIVYNDLTLAEELDRLQSLVLKKDTVIRRLKRQLQRLQDADEENTIRMSIVSTNTSTKSSMPPSSTTSDIEQLSENE